MNAQLRKLLADMRAGNGCDVPYSAVLGWADGIEAAVAAPKEAAAPQADQQGAE